MMKRFFLAGLFLPWLCFAFSQTQQTLPQKLQHFYAPLDKSQVPTGFLYDLSWSFATPSNYRGVLTDSNFVSPDVFGMLFGALLGSMIDSVGLPSPSVFLSRSKPPFLTDTVPLAMLAMRFDRIRPDAVDSDLLYFNNGQIFDVPGRSQSPYFQDTVFAATVLRAEINTRKVVFQLPGELFFGNLSGLPAISIDPGDGLGWRPLSIGQSDNVEYPSDGEKIIILRLEYPGFERYSHTKLNILPASAGDRMMGMVWPQNLYESLHVTASESYLGAAGGATMHIFYNTRNCNSVKRMIRPLIVVEGYEDGAVSNTYDRMFRLLNAAIMTSNSENLTDYLHPYEYDLIYVDFNDGSDWIQRNALVVKEVIKKVNEMKAAAGSTEENVIIGVSMGGIVSKYALLNMQANGPDHETRLFFTYDSPLRGANIPLATQCLVKFMVDNLPTYAGGQISVPSIEAIWEQIQAPVPRQLLKYHVNGLVDGTGLDNVAHATFMTELDGMGGLNMRHVALSNGAGTGTFLENNMVAGQLFFELDGQKVQCEEVGPFIFCGDVRFSVRLRATGGSGPSTLFYGFIEKDIPGPFNLISTDWTVNLITKPYDTSPGGTTNLGVAPLGNSPGGLQALLVSAGVTTSGPGLTATHHCFEPTYSSVSASEPSNFGTPVTCGTADRCSTASSPETSPYSGLPEINQAHVFLDERIALVLVEELVTNSPPPAPHPLVISDVLNEYFNVGLAIYSPIPSVTINTGSGKLSINNTGKVAFSTGNEPNSPHLLLVADTKCNAIITVENGARLVVGADGAVKHGVLNVSTGSTVHIKSGGLLHVTSEQSQLLIRNGATLILDPGAIVRLESPGANIRIEGDLVVNGDINFSGLGYFDFGPGNRLVFGPGYKTFNLAGAGKDKRFARLSADVLLDKGNRLNWSNGLVEVAGALRLTQGAGLHFFQMTLDGDAGSAYATAIDAYQSGNVTLQGCDVLNLNEAVVGQEGLGCHITGCHFSNNAAWSILWTGAFAVNVKNSIFDGSGSSSATGINAVDVGFLVLDGCTFMGFDSPGIEEASPAVNLENVVACLVEGSHFNVSTVGIKAAPENSAATANVYAYGGSSFIGNRAAIYVNGNATQGAVLADCVTFQDNKHGIKGKDISLMIDSWNSKTFVFDTDSPNRFIRDNVPQGGTTFSHVDICYEQKAPGGSRPMRNNFWGISTGGVPANDPTPLNFINLRNAACNANVAAPILSPFGSKNPVCTAEERPPSFAVAFPGSECSVVLPAQGGSANNSATVHELFHFGAYLLKSDSAEQAIEVLRPVAELWQPDLSAMPSNCQQYIQVSKAFVDASDNMVPNGLPRPGKERGTAPSPPVFLHFGQQPAEQRKAVALVAGVE